MSDPARFGHPNDDAPPRPPPRSVDLPCEDGIPMDRPEHQDQMVALIQSLELHWEGRDDFYAGGNMFLYFSELQARKGDFRGPDFFVVRNTDRHKPRNTWTVWEEDGQTPDLIVELTSDSTKQVDYGEKKRVYERIGVGEYLIYDMQEDVLHGWRRRMDGYAPIEPTAAGRIPSEALGLEFGLWRGEIRDLNREWLRLYTPDGELLPLPVERANAEAERADAEAERANAEAERANAEAERANAEAERANALEAELAALRGQRHTDQS